MAKIGLLFIVICIATLVWAVIRIVDKLNAPKTPSHPDMEKTISDLKSAIAFWELEAEKGILNAETKLATYKEQLEKALALKEKTKSL